MDPVTVEVEDGAVTVTPEPVSDAVVAEAAEAVVAAAETAVALAEGQAAIAGQQAAMAVIDAQQEAEQAAQSAQAVERNTEWLVDQVMRLQQQTSDLTSLIQSKPWLEQPTTVVVAEQAVVTDGETETTSVSTPNDTSELTAETPTEVIAESEPAGEAAAAVVARRRRRWI